SSIYEVVVPPVYTFINTIKGKDHFYVAEQLISEADFYSIIYYNHTGKIIHKQGIDGKNYEKIFCDN
ncbi:MAG: hypothetical protein OEY34_06195, partial [Cyclobacteriaceae bacterium]|nr:hypothetical protein [Cyclobacteriaceae bacterium]